MTTATASKRPAKPKKDLILSKAVEVARKAANEVAESPSDVGEHVGAVMVEERLMSHQFACNLRGYTGWVWTVTVARPPRGRAATICEVELLPTNRAILAPEWLPWAQRLQPGDLGPGDVLPFQADDPRLTPGYVATGDEEQDSVAIEELALARARILSEDGRNATASRWYAGSHGPRSAGSLQSAAGCGSCGFMVPLQGALGQVFGVCTNAWSPDDGKVVALGHGCGAHSETDVPVRASLWPTVETYINDSAVEEIPAAELVAQDPVEPGEQEVQEPAQELVQEG